MGAVFWLQMLRNLPSRKLNQGDSTGLCQIMRLITWLPFLEGIYE